MVYDEYVTLASKSKMQGSAAGQMAQGRGCGVRGWLRGVGDIGRVRVGSACCGGGEGGQGGHVEG